MYVFHSSSIKILVLLLNMTLDIKLLILIHPDTYIHTYYFVCFHFCFLSKRIYFISFVFFSDNEWMNEVLHLEGQSIALAVCGQNREEMKKKQAFEYLHHVFQKFTIVSIKQLLCFFICWIFDMLTEVTLVFTPPTQKQNIYLSGQDCTNHVTDGSVAYIGNPGLIEKEPYSVFLNGKSVLISRFSFSLFLSANSVFTNLINLSFMFVF